MALPVLCLVLLMTLLLPCAVSSGFPTLNNLISRFRREVDPSIRGNGNGLIDESIVYWKEWLKENGYDPLHIDSYSKRVEPFVFNLRDCAIVGLTTFKRTGDVSLNATESFVVVVANVGIEDVTLDCKVELRWSVVRARGSISANVKDYSVEGTIVQVRPPPRMTALRITNKGSLDLKFDGEGVMGTVVQWLAEGYLKYKLQSLLTDTEQIMEIANEVLLSIDVDNIVSVT